MSDYTPNRATSRRSQNKADPARPGGAGYRRANALIDRGWLTSRSLSPIELSVWLAYNRFADPDGLTTAKIGVIQKILGHLRPNHIQAAILKLQKLGLIECLADGNVRVLTPPLRDGVREPIWKKDLAENRPTSGQTAVPLRDDNCPTSGQKPSHFGTQHNKEEQTIEQTIEQNTPQPPMGDVTPFAESLFQSPRETKAAGKEVAPACARRASRIGEEPTSFNSFWSAYPTHTRKTNKAGCLQKWKRQRLEEIAPDVLTGLARWNSSHQWAKDGGEYIPAPLVWLNKRNWEAPAEAFEANPAARQPRHDRRAETMAMIDRVLPGETNEPDRG